MDPEVDDGLVERLRDLTARHDPPPPELAVAARVAFALPRVEAALAALLAAEAGVTPPARPGAHPGR